MGRRGHVNAALKGPSIAGGMGTVGFIEGAVSISVNSYYGGHERYLRVASLSPRPSDLIGCVVA